MLGGRKRLWALGGLLLVLVVVYLALHGLPWSSSDYAGPAEGASAGSTSSGTEAGPASAGGGASGSAAAGAGNPLPAASIDSPTYRRVTELARQRKPENLPELEAAAKSPDWRARHAAVSGIGRLGLKGDPQLLISTLRNAQESPEVRANAAEWLGDMACWDAGPALIDALEDPLEVVRMRAGVAFRKLVIVDMGFRASDPPDRRRAAVERIRFRWPDLLRIHHENLQLMQHKD